MKQGEIKDPENTNISSSLDSSHALRMTSYSSDQIQFLSIVASLEQSSEHPLAEAIVNHAKENNIALLETT